MIVALIPAEDNSDIIAVITSKKHKSIDKLTSDFKECLKSISEAYQELADETNPEHPTYWIPEDGESYGIDDWDDDVELTDLCKEYNITYIANPVAINVY